MKPTTKDERSLLLYLETRAVDYSGRIRNDNLNRMDWDLLNRWTDEGYIKSGRIASEYLDKLSYPSTHWIVLSPEAMTDAHELRRQRAERMWRNKSYLTTEEKRAS